MESNQLNCFKPKMRRHKLRRFINWAVALKQKFIKQMVIKQGLGVLGIYKSPLWNI
jgi:hypothetical protein